MLGAFYCPHCHQCNACDCESCKYYINETDQVVKHTEDGNGLICPNCGKEYSYDQALDTEYKISNQNHPL